MAMKMEFMKKCLLVTVIAGLFAFTSAQAQAPDYKTGLGVRVGGTSGVTLKHFYSRNMAVEGILGFFGNGTSVTGLIERHDLAFDTKGLRFYYGGGAHVAFYNGRYYYRNGFWRDIDHYDSREVAFGINGIVGLEYKIEELPIAVSLDFKPFVEIGPGGYVGFSPDPSIGIKFTIH
jgi:hypothetical protein